MTHNDALTLLRPALQQPGGIWADLGAGSGTFTHALAQLLGSDGHIYAVDRDTHALRKLRAAARPGAAAVTTIVADFTQPLALGDLQPGELDGVLLANALHFVPDAAAVLSSLAAWLRPGGRMILIEYDRRAASRWVPFPIDRTHLPALISAAGLAAPEFVAERASAFGGSLYVAVSSRS